MYPRAGSPSETSEIKHRVILKANLWLPGLLRFCERCVTEAWQGTNAPHLVPHSTEECARLQVCLRYSVRDTHTLAASGVSEPEEHQQVLAGGTGPESDKLGR